MNPSKELNKIASEIEKLAQGTYVKLMRLDTEEELDDWARKGGWEGAQDISQDLRYPIEELLGNYVDVDVDEEITEPPQGVLGTVSPIMAIVHSRLFDESATGILTDDGKHAYITYEDFENLF